MNKFKTSWQIFLRTCQVMRDHKTLLFFPIVITFFTLCITAFFVAPIVLQPTGYSYRQAAHWKAIESRVFTVESVKALGDAKQRHAQVHFTNGMLGYFWVVYFISMFLAAFFNTAFCSQIMAALKGSDVSIKAGLQFAAVRWKTILVWSLLTGLVGILLRKIEEKIGFVGRIVVGLIGLTWSVACIFAIPVIVEEGAIVNPLDVLRKSAGAIRKTWGEALIGYAGLEFTGVLVLLGSIVILGLGGLYAYLAVSIWPMIIAAAAWFATVCLLAYLSQVAGQIYQSALYLYATTGSVPRHFDRPMMDVAWKRKS